MGTHFVRAVGAVAAAAALTVLGLADVGTVGAAAAPRSAATGRATKVPASFQPTAAGFISPAWGVAISPAWGVALGGVGCTVGHTCRARLAATADGGAQWYFLTAPDVWLANRSPQVSQVVFASRRDGWLYDQYLSRWLWATHDGGARWRRLSLGGDIRAMAASAGTVYAVAGDELFSSPAGRDAWARVGTMTGGSVAVSGKAAWFGASTAGASSYLWASADGVHWHKYPFRCPAGLGLAGIAPTSPTYVAFLCAFAQGTFHTVKDVLRSVNGGRTEHLTGQAPVSGDVYGFAGPSNRSKLITIAVVSPGPDYLYRSANGGKTWAEIAVPGTGGGVGLSSLSYVSPTVGWVVVSGPSVADPHQLLRASDAGRTWHAVRFRDWRVTA